MVAAVRRVIPSRLHVQRGIEVAPGGAEQLGQIEHQLVSLRKDSHARKRNTAGEAFQSSVAGGCFCARETSRFCGRATGFTAAVSN